MQKNFEDLKNKVYLKSIQIFSLNRAVNTSSLGYKSHQLILQDLHETHKYILWAECKYIEW
jgi:hypothetical protein